MNRTKWILLFIVVASCSDRVVDLEKDVLQESLIGKWDAYVAIDEHGNTMDNPSDILLNYEHGFQLNADGTYNPRYLNVEKFTFWTSDIEHHWELIDGDRIVFGDYDASGKISGLTYEIIQITEDELWIGPGLEFRLKRGN